MNHLFSEITLDLLYKLGLALFCGSAIGLERQYRGKASGIRTSNLVCLGTVLFMYLGQTLTGTNGDPSRTLGQIITGIGFLGAGGIIANTNNGSITGLTSAAVVWMLAAIGCCIGLGFYQVAVLFTFITGVVLFCAGWIEKIFKHVKDQ
jgi:putative Mg2+ transporter-C (MgtC) family protein